MFKTKHLIISMLLATLSSQSYCQIGSIPASSHPMEYNCTINLNELNTQTLADMGELFVKDVEVVLDEKFHLHKIPNTNSGIVTRLVSMDDVPEWKGTSTFFAYFIKNLKSITFNGVIEPSMVINGFANPSIGTTFVNGQIRFQALASTSFGHISTELSAYCELIIR